MRLIAQLIVVLLCAVTMFTGCDQRVTEPVMDVISPPQTNIEKARAAMKRVNQRRTESQQKAKAAGDYTTVFTNSETIFKEELGFRKGFWVELVNIYRGEKSSDSAVSNGFSQLQEAFATRLEENTLGMVYFEYIRTFDVLIVEYLRLSYVYPAHSEDALLTRFRKSVREGKVSITFPGDF